MTIKIYVASLEAYNSGRMVGDWITPNDFSDFEKFRPSSMFLCFISFPSLSYFWHLE